MSDPHPGPGPTASAERGSRSALRRLVAGDPDTFAARSWGREAVLSRADDLAKHREEPGPAGFADLFSLAAVDELLSRRGLRTPFLRIAKQGAVLDSSQFTGGGGVGAEIADQVRDDRVAELFADGHTVVLQGLHRTWAPVADLVADLTDDLGHPVQVNAYVTPASSQGFSAHYDVHDVFVLQVAGSKRWSIHAPVHPEPLRHQPWTDRAAEVAQRAEQEPLVDEVLHPGDVLYLPRGYLHSATAQGEVSAHLTVGVHVVTRHALLDALVATLDEDPELRAALPLGIDVADPDALAPHLRAVAERAAATLTRSADRGEDIARRVRRRVWSGNRPEPLAPLAQAAAADAVTPATRVRARRGVRHRLVPGERLGLEVPAERLGLELPDRTLDLPADTAPALERLLAGPPVRVDALPPEGSDAGGSDAGGTDGAVLVARLLREGVLVPADADPGVGAEAGSGGTTDR